MFTKRSVHILSSCFGILITIGCALLFPQPAVAQFPFAQPSLRTVPKFLVTELSAIDAAPVYFDGRQIFSLTAPRLSTESEEEGAVKPIQERIRAVRQQLNAVAQETTSKDVEVTYHFLNQGVGSDRQLAELKVNGQYILTINATDAKLYSTDVGTHAQFVTSLIKTALIRYHQERQPEYQRNRVLWSVAILILGVAVTGATQFIRQLLGQRRDRKIQRLTQLQPSANAIATDLTVAEQEEALNQAELYDKIHDQKTRIKSRYDILLRGMQLVLIGLWLSSIALILSFFPQTRAFQSQTLAKLFSTLLHIGLSLFGLYILIKISFIVIDYGFGVLRAGQMLAGHQPVRSVLRLRTLSSYVKSVCVFGLTLGGILLILQIVGVDLAPLLAGAGILGLAISFGAQNLIKDVINGLFLIWEDQFGVGDVVSINDVTGAVETMNLRITQLRSQDGDLITVPNGAINLVKNHSNQWSRANLGIDIAYDTDLDRALDIIRKTAVMMANHPQWEDAILEEPEVLGVDAFGENSLTIRLWIKTAPLKQWDVSREFRRQLKQAFDREDIRILFPRRAIWLQDEK